MKRNKASDERSLAFVETANAQTKAQSQDGTSESRDTIHLPGTSRQTRSQKTLQQATPGEGALADPLLPTTKQGKPRQRTKWTNEMNEYICRRYLVLTNIETSHTGISKELHNNVLKQFPELATKTVQNILDQKRTIITSNKIPKGTMNRIKEEVKMELETNNTMNETTESENEEPHIEEQQNTTQIQNNTNIKKTSHTANEEVDINNIFEENMIKFNGISPTLRPLLPKLKSNKHIINKIRLVNNLIKEKVNSCDNITDIHTLVYVGAATVLIQNKQNLRERGKNNISIINRTPKWEDRLQRIISELRKEIGQLTQSLQNKTNKNIKKRANHNK